jgi:hypothetical protein
MAAQEHFREPPLSFFSFLRRMFLNRRKNPHYLPVKKIFLDLLSVLFPLNGAKHPNRY